MAHDETDQQAARALRDAVRRLILAHAGLRESRRPCGTALPMPHAWALLELREHGTMTVTDLASRLNIDRTNVSRLTGRMASAGELTRTPHPDDGRARLLTLTEHGAALASSVDAGSARHFAAISARLAHSPEAVLATLHALTAAMKPPESTP